jgi:uncharacterized protein YndB with AHSA1/START domain
MAVLSIRRNDEALTLTVVAEFDASVERVWQVWEDPRLLERWWGPPGYPATFEQHDLAPGGEVTYYMTGPDGEKLRAWWRIREVDAPRSLRFEEGNAPGGPRDDVPTTSIDVRLIETSGKTTMTIACRFASIPGKEELLDTGTQEGMRQAIGQIDAILAS